MGCKGCEKKAAKRNKKMTKIEKPLKETGDGKSHNDKK
jgi:hypothetical protein